MTEKSYNQRVKEGLLNRKQKKCCEKAELYGYLLTSDTFTPELIIFNEKNNNITDYFTGRITEMISVSPEITVNRDCFLCTVPDVCARKLIDRLGATFNNGIIDRKLINKECCAASFLRGAFISTGVLSDPKKRYQLEFVFADYMLCEMFGYVFAELGYTFNMTERKGKYVLYMKSLESIKDVLSSIGAIEPMFDYINAEIYKELKNNVNRIVNFENANIDKAVNSITRQRAAIRYLKAEGYTYLDEKLKEAAEICLNSESSRLEDMANEFSPPLSKSALYRRLKKITDIAVSRGFSKVFGSSENE